MCRFEHVDLSEIDWDVVKRLDLAILVGLSILGIFLWKQWVGLLTPVDFGNMNML